MDKPNKPIPGAYSVELVRLNSLCRLKNFFRIAKSRAEPVFQTSQKDPET
jgi:hypothetical protein